MADESARAACIEGYNKYLNSIVGISFSTKEPRYYQKVKYNGRYYWCSVRRETDQNGVKVDSTWEYNWSQDGDCVSLIDEGNEGGFFLLSYLDRTKNPNKMEDAFILSELFGRMRFGDPLGQIVFIDFLHNKDVQVEADRRDGMDLVLAFGSEKKFGASIKIWFDPNLGFAVRTVEVKRTENIKPGEFTHKNVSFDKFTMLGRVGVPTECQWADQQIGPADGKSYNSGGSITLFDFKKLDASHPKPFSFETLIPNGTPAHLEDAPQIEYIWLDGEIVPRTDENMLKIAMGDHKFMPGVDSWHFWFMLLGFLILAAGLTLKGIELYKKWHKDDGKKDKKKEDKKE